MDWIEPVVAPSRHVESPHLVILLNGRPMDVVISESSGRDEIHGLVCTLDGNLADSSDREIVWATIDPEPGAAAIAPLLVCPDCLDFGCSVVVAEIVADAGTVSWRRFGLDQSVVPCDPVGTDVLWLEDVPGFEFDAREYGACLRNCRRMARDWWG